MKTPLKSFLLLVFSLGLLGKTAAQDNHARALGFQSDNDAYLLRKNDRYYTNGLALRYQWRKKDGPALIHSLELGQKIFTPLNRNIRSTAQIDRPYAGYLYARYAQLAFPHPRWYYQWNLTLGMIGPSSGGEGLQRFYHRLLRYAQFNGWRYQIGNQVGIDAGGQAGYTWGLSPSFKIMPLADLRLGTQFIQASVGAYFVWGAFGPTHSSALLHSGLAAKTEAPRKKAEAFFYWYPQAMAQPHNATIQGAWQQQADSAVTGKLSPFQWGQTLGFCYAHQRMVIKLEWTQWSKEAQGQFLNHRWAGFQVMYRFL